MPAPNVAHDAVWFTAAAPLAFGIALKVVAFDAASVDALVPSHQPQSAAVSHRLYTMHVSCVQDAPLLQVRCRGYERLFPAFYMSSVPCHVLPTRRVVVQMPSAIAPLVANRPSTASVCSMAVVTAMCWISYLQPVCPCLRVYTTSHPLPPLCISHVAVPSIGEGQELSHPRRARLAVADVCAIAIAATTADGWHNCHGTG